MSRWRSPASGTAATSAASAAAFTSRSTSSRSAASSSSVAMPSAISRRREGDAAGSRRASSSRSAARAVDRLVVGERVRVGADDLGVDEGRPAAGTAVGHRLAHDGEAGQRVAAVHLADQQVGERAHQLRDAAARGLHLDRHRDRVAVVLDEVEDGQLAVAGGVEALPELALGGRALAGRAVDDLVLALLAPRSTAAPRRSRRPAGTGCRWGRTWSRR